MNFKNGKIYFCVQQFDLNGNLTFTHNETTLRKAVAECKWYRKNDSSKKTFCIKPLECFVFGEVLKTYHLVCTLVCSQMVTSLDFNDRLLKEFNFVNS